MSPAPNRSAYGCFEMWRIGVVFQQCRESEVLTIEAIDQRGCESRPGLRCCWFDCSLESGCLKVQPKVGDKLHLRLNIDSIAIANKYREGKLQRTLKREFKRT
ncbi:hypothetical protein B9Z55_000614 [Caenorhabditis nigoni]|jgi:hypothetical protein|uniref:Uncharacterized protein n=1 Tax=Caenorhabditis nigoni TaxID=1611254 RepID=A0A2G5VUA0_9PELO|nr:hypothetical protein B9Z55_000614 [Caenorhabditis nigoni]